MPRPLTGLLVAVVFCALVGAAYAVQNVALGRPAAEQSPLDPVPDADDGEQLVVLFGDSLLEAAVDQLRVRFAADPDRRLSAHWYGGTEVDTTAWLELYPHVGEGTEVLLALGVNDVFNGSVADATGDVARVLDALTEAGASRVIMPTITLNRLTTATTLDDAGTPRSPSTTRGSSPPARTRSASPPSRCSDGTRSAPGTPSGCSTTGST